ncbi:hypothetical protein GGG16DRAFT_125301 [Schizophyllum commune]
MGHAPNGTRRHRHHHIARASNLEAINHSELEATMDEALIQWGTDVPESKMRAQSPGYNVIDNVVLFNKTMYIVTDKPETFPPLKTIVASTGQTYNDWKIISKKDAPNVLGKHAGIMRGVTWMAADADVHNTTLFALWRTYASLDPNTGADSRTALTPPTRLFFPQIRVYNDPNPPFQDYWIRRRRSPTGFHPFTFKAAFPHLSTLFLEAWEDYHQMEVPYFIERIVIADRRAALEAGKGTYGGALELPASKHWWEPKRRTLAQYFDTYEEGNANKRVITYIQRQHATTGSKLRAEDHAALLDALGKLGREVEVHVASDDDEETNWTRRLSSITRSEIVIGVHGGQLMDAVYMKPSSRSTLLEFFPANGFCSDRQLAMQSLGIDYHAWTETKYIYLASVRIGGR